MGSETLQRVGSEFLQKAGRSTLKAAVGAIALGAVTLFVAHQGWQLPIESGVLLALLAAVALFVWLLVLAVGGLERQLGESRETAMIQGRKIGAHRAIAAWVDGCESSLSDRGQSLPREAKIAQELRYLETAVINSLSSYSFYPQGMTEKVQAIAAGEPGQSEEERLQLLLAYLRKQLQAGSYLV